MYIHIGWIGSTQHFFYVANVSTVLTLWDLERSTAAEYAERKRNLHKCRAATRRRPFLQIHNPTTTATATASATGECGFLTFYNPITLRHPPSSCRGPCTSHFVSGGGRECGCLWNYLLLGFGPSTLLSRAFHRLSYGTRQSSRGKGRAR